MDNNIRSVWIIDDDAVYRYAFRKFVEMKRLCPDVVDFGDGEKAIDFLKNPDNTQNLPDVIFLDVDMPGMDGWAFIKAFEKIKPSLAKTIPIMMVTSSLNYNDIVQSQNYTDITDYILKPINSQQFALLFTNHLSKQSA